MAVAIKEQHVERVQEMMPISSTQNVHAFGKDVHSCLLLLMLQMHKKGLDDKDISRLMKNIEENYGSSDDDNSDNNITLDMKENIFLLLGSMMHNAKKVNNMNKMAVLAKEKESQKEYQNSVDKWSEDNKTATEKAGKMYTTSVDAAHPLNWVAMIGGAIGIALVCAAIGAAIGAVLGAGVGAAPGAVIGLVVGIVVAVIVCTSEVKTNHSNYYSKNKTLDQGKYSDWQNYTNGTINQDQSESQKRLQETQTIMQSEFDPLQQNDQEFYNLLNTCYNWFGQIGQSKS